MATLRDPVPENDLSLNRDKEVELIAASPTHNITDEVSGELLHHAPGLDWADGGDRGAQGGAGVGAGPGGAVRAARGALGLLRGPDLRGERRDGGAVRGSR